MNEVTVLIVCLSVNVVTLGVAVFFIRKIINNCVKEACERLDAKAADEC